MRRIALMICLALLVAGCSATSSGASSPPATTLTPNPAIQAGDWLQFGYDSQHSGVNPNETTLNPQNVGTLHRLWSAKLSDPADSSPVLLGSVALPSGKTGAVIYVTTKRGSLVALDASTGAQLWATPSQGPNVTNSSPAVDPSKQFVYSYGLDGKVHKYQAGSGQEVAGNGWPLNMTLMTSIEKGSSALTIANDRLYAEMSGYFGDGGQYVGHIVSQPLAGGPPIIWNALCSDKRELLVQDKKQPNYCSDAKAGIWSRAGVIADAAQNDMLVATGNGAFSLTPAKSGGTSWGNSVAALSPDLGQVIDSYTPKNLSVLNDADLDLGSTAPALLPRITNSKTPLMAVQGGKDGVLRLLNRQNLSGQGGPGHLGGEVATTGVPGPGGKCLVFTQPAVWTDASGTVWVFLADNCGTAGYQVQTDANSHSSLHRAWLINQNGNSPVVAGGVLFLPASGKLLALNPQTGATLWDSSAAQANGSIGSIHWESPIVVNGHVYMTDESGNLYAYGL